MHIKLSLPYKGGYLLSMETSDRIAEKASELFLKYGIRSVTMDDIAVHLGMSKKTVYKFFDNKNALVENFILKETAINMNSCNLLVSTNNDPLTRLFFTMVCAQKFYFKLNPIIIHSLKKDYHKSYLILKQHKEEFLFQSIKHSIEDGISQHLYQNDFNIDSMSRFFLESLTIIPDNNYDSDQEVILAHMISGIATSAGLDKINWHRRRRRFTSCAQTLRQPFQNVV